MKDNGGTQGVRDAVVVETSASINCTLLFRHSGKRTGKYSPKGLSPLSYKKPLMDRNSTLQKSQI